MLNPQNWTGVLRSAVQAFFASALLTIAPVLEALGILDEVTAIEGGLASLVVGLAVGLYWLIFNYIQTHPKVVSNPFLKQILAILMGGTKTPDYSEPE